MRPFAFQYKNRYFLAWWGRKKTILKSGYSLYGPLAFCFFQTAYSCLPFPPEILSIEGRRNRLCLSYSLRVGLYIFFL